nr:hypothetical protein GCM10020185_07260 [Pseudomonas brassicacearum subsp. brassicacearum]
MQQGEFHDGTSIHKQVRLTVTPGIRGQPIDPGQDRGTHYRLPIPCRRCGAGRVFFRLQSAPQITSSFKAQLSYLFQIVRNLAIDHYRKQALELKYSGPEEEGLNVVIQGASPETSHINFSTLEHIADALTELPSRTRYAFEMYRLHGVPQKDIAKELGVSPTLVNFMIRDALVHCRKVSGGFGGIPSPGGDMRCQFRPHRGQALLPQVFFWQANSV